MTTRTISIPDEPNTMRDPISGGRAIVVGTLIAALFWLTVWVLA